MHLFLSYILFIFITLKIDNLLNYSMRDRTLSLP